MLSFKFNTTEKISVNTSRPKLNKIMVCGLVMVSLLVAGALLLIMAVRNAPIIEDTTSLYSKTEEVSGNPSFSSADNGNNQLRSARMVAAPTVYTTLGKLVSEREPLEFTLSATDADGDSLVYSAASLPEGASFDPSTRTFSWTPRYDQAGVYTVHFEVSDGEFTDSEDIIITIVQLYDDWDINGDGAANVLDMVLVGQHWDESGLTGWIREDANEDGTVDVLDMIIIGQYWNG